MRELRRASLKWWARREAIVNAFVRKEGRRHFYKCAKCDGEFPRKGVQADHINPVIDPTKKTFTIEEFCDRLLVGVDGFQILCLKCHEEKTIKENEIRDKVKGPRKGKGKKDGTRKKCKKSRLGRSGS